MLWVSCKWVVRDRARRGALGKGGSSIDGRDALKLGRTIERRGGEDQTMDKDRSRLRKQWLRR